MWVCTVVARVLLLCTGTRSAATLINNAEQLPHVHGAGSSPLPHGAGPGPGGHPGMAHHHHPGARTHTQREREREREDDGRFSHDHGQGHLAVIGAFACLLRSSRQLCSRGKRLFHTSSFQICVRG